MRGEHTDFQTTKQTKIFKKSTFDLCQSHSDASFRNSPDKPLATGVFVQGFAPYSNSLGWGNINSSSLFSAHRGTTIVQISFWIGTRTWSLVTANRTRWSRSTFG